MHALITHWTSVKEAPRNRPIAGSETATNRIKHDQRRDKRRDQENAEPFLLRLPLLVRHHSMFECHDLMLVWIGSAAHCGVVLRRLAAIEHRVIANNTDVANAVRLRKQHPFSLLEVLDGTAVFPHQLEAQIAWRQDSVV